MERLDVDCCLDIVHVGDILDSNVAEVVEVVVGSLSIIVTSIVAVVTCSLVGLWIEDGFSRSFRLLANGQQKTSAADEAKLNEGLNTASVE